MTRKNKRAMNVYAAIVITSLAASGCQGSGAASNSDPASREAASAAASIEPIKATEGVQQTTMVEERDDECSPGQRIDPATLAASWPARVGKRVRFKSRVELSVDVMDAVVTAAGHRFVVIAGPDQLWEGEMERIFTVMGSTTVALRGRTTLPQLLLEAKCKR